MVMISEGEEAKPYIVNLAAGLGGEMTLEEREGTGTGEQSGRGGGGARRGGQHTARKAQGSGERHVCN